jgi:hypothetical protein
LDDMIFFSATLEQHFRDLERVLTLLHRAGVTFKLSKCQLFRDSVRYLGHIVGLKVYLSPSQTQWLFKKLYPQIRVHLSGIFLDSVMYLEDLRKDFPP